MAPERFRGWAGASAALSCPPDAWVGACCPCSECILARILWTNNMLCSDWILCCEPMLRRLRIPLCLHVPLDPRQLLVRRSLPCLCVVFQPLMHCSAELLMRCYCYGLLRRCCQCLCCGGAGQLVVARRPAGTLPISLGGTAPAPPRSLPPRLQLRWRVPALAGVCQRVWVQPGPARSVPHQLPRRAGQPANRGGRCRL